MRRYLILLLVLCLGFVGCKGCKDEEKEEQKETITYTTLYLKTTSHPQGGTAVTSVSATFSGQLNYTTTTKMWAPEEQGTPEPITATFEWWWHDYYGQNEKNVKSETHRFTSPSSEQFTTTYSAGQGNVLLNYYWVKVYWNDKDSDKTYQEMETNKAFCQ